ncbi:MAG: hypothetical protein R3A78_14710 [Polyangiales bacterium]
MGLSLFLATGLVTSGALADTPAESGGDADSSGSKGTSAPSARTYYRQESKTVWKARKLFLDGQKAYREGRFEEAIGLFRNSMGLVRNPGVLLFIGEVADRLGRDQEAADAFREYLSLVPGSSRREELRSRIRILSDSAYLRRGDPRVPFRTSRAEVSAYSTAYSKNQNPAFSQLRLLDDR